MEPLKHAFIVITSINGPTEAIRKFAKIPSHSTIVVGDKKTPVGWHCPNVQFLSYQHPSDCFSPFVELLRPNHYSRKMIGYLHAIQQGANIIIDSDDDNIPMKNWSFPPVSGCFEYVEDNLQFINVYNFFTSKKIWPRGLPLSCINIQKDLEKHLSDKNVKIGIWQGLANENPDVDAIYRLTNKDFCNFKKREPIVLGKGTITPFNSQNTLFRKELFPLLYLPTHVSFRFTDILRSWIAQPIMWEYNFSLGFTSATVVQKRNIHDNFKDFISELSMYRYSEKIIDKISNVISSRSDICDNLFNAYETLATNRIIPKKEINVLYEWINQIKNISTSFYKVL